jgi:hypothetical protein
MIITKPFFVSSKSCPYVIVTVILYAGAFSFNTILLTVSRTTVKRILINRNDGLTIFFLYFSGTTRTRKAQESYEKHLNVTVKEVK